MTGSHTYFYIAEIRRSEAEEGIQMIHSIMAWAFLCVLGLYKWEARQKSPGCILVQTMRLLVLPASVSPRSRLNQNESRSAFSSEKTTKMHWQGTWVILYQFCLLAFLGLIFRIFLSVLRMSNCYGYELEIAYTHRTPGAVTFEKSTKFPNLRFKSWELVQSSPQNWCLLLPSFTTTSVWKWDGLGRADNPISK